MLARLVAGTLTLLLAVSLLRDRIPELMTEQIDGGGMTRDVASLRWPLPFLGTENAVVPHVAIAWGEKFITSGTASIFDSTVPLCTALFVLTLPLFSEERQSLFGLAGLVLGFVGIGVLVTGDPGDGAEAGHLAFLLGGAVVLLGLLATLSATSTPGGLKASPSSSPQSARTSAACSPSSRLPSFSGSPKSYLALRLWPLLWVSGPGAPG